MREHEQGGQVLPSGAHTLVRRVDGRQIATLLGLQMGRAMEAGVWCAERGLPWACGRGRARKSSWGEGGGRRDLGSGSGGQALAGGLGFAVGRNHLLSDCVLALVPPRYLAASSRGHLIIRPQSGISCAPHSPSTHCRPPSPHSIPSEGTGWPLLGAPWVPSTHSA